MIAAWTPTPNAARSVPSGPWGGRGIALTVEDSGAKIEMDCAHGRITGRLVLDADGRFELPGTFTRERPGPVHMHVGLVTALLSPTVRLTLATGVMGGFTTYSSFNYETIRQIQDGAWPTALAYVAATVLGCLAAGYAGVALARSIWGG